MMIGINSRMLKERIEGLAEFSGPSLAVAVVAIIRWRREGKVS